MSFWLYDYDLNGLGFGSAKVYHFQLFFRSKLKVFIRGIERPLTLSHIAMFQLQREMSKQEEVFIRIRGHSFTLLYFYSDIWLTSQYTITTEWLPKADAKGIEIKRKMHLN